MKRPKYFLNTPIKEREDEFQAWIEIQVFWNEDFVPEHLKEKLIEARKFNLHKDTYYMCLIGKHWVVIPKGYITERY